MGKIAFQIVKPAERPLFTKSFDEFPVNGDVLTLSVRRPGLAERLNAQSDIDHLKALYPISADGSRNMVYVGGQFFAPCDQHFNIAAYLASVQASTDSDERYSANEFLAMLYGAPELFEAVLDWLEEVIPVEGYEGN